MPEYDYNRIVSVNAENDKNTSLQMGVWNGNATITVFSNRNQVARLPMNRFFLVDMTRQIRKLLIGKPGDKYSWGFTKWDNEAKKSHPVGSLVVGRDDKALIYLGVQVTGHPPMKFLLKTPISFDSSTPMSEVDRSDLAAETLIQQLTVDIPQAIINTTYKRTDIGGNRSGSGNGGSGQSDSVSIF
jgi:hypothetical protein